MATQAIDWKQRASEMVREDEAFANALAEVAGARAARRAIAETEARAIAVAATMARRKDPEKALATEIRRLKKAALEACAKPRRRT
jgi:hypothetical protein